MKPIIKKTTALLLSVILLAGASTIARADETTTEPSIAITNENGEPVTDENGEMVTLSPEEKLEMQKKDLEAKLKESQEKLEKYSADQKETEEYINSLDEKIGYLNEELSLLDSQITTAKGKINTLKAEARDLKKEIAIVQNEYDSANEEIQKLQAKFQSTYNAYCARIRAMYISGSDSVLVALLTSKDISQMLSRYEMIKAVTKSDTRLLKEVKTQTEEITNKNKDILGKKELLEKSKAVLDEKRKIIEKERAGVEAKQGEIAVKKITLAEDRAESDALLAQVSAKTKMYSEFKYEDEALLEQVNGEIDAVLQGLKAPEEITTAVANSTDKKEDTDTSGSSSLYYNSAAVLNMTYPAPGHYSISAPFGHYSNGKPHSGTDFPYPTGSKVVAAQKGIVIKTRELNYSYGKYIMIYHGTDNKGRKIVTLYAHNSALLVSVGQTVEKGQQIAKGGSTGNSTGPHCHFELIIDGVKFNAIPYLSK